MTSAKSLSAEEFSELFSSCSPSSLKEISSSLAPRSSPPPPFSCGIFFTHQQQFWKKNEGERKAKKKKKPKKFCPPPKKILQEKDESKVNFFLLWGLFLLGRGKREEGRGRGGRSSARVSLGFFFLSFPRIRSMCKKIINKKRGVKKNTHTNNNKKSDIKSKGGGSRRYRRSSCRSDLSELKLD